MNYGVLMLSKVIEQNDPNALLRFNITAEDLPTEGERKALRYITEYAEKHGGQAPTAEMLAHEVPDFEPDFNIEASYEYLAEKLRKQAALREFVDIAEKELPDRFSQAQDNPEELFSWLTEKVESLKIRTNVRSSIGRTLSEIKESFRDEYKKREEGKSFRIYKTPFPTLDNEISGWFTGDIYGIMGESGRGKTYLVCRILDSLLRQGANCLVKSFEVKEYTFISRLISIATAVDEVLIDELGRKVGIPNKAILSGKLDDVVREKFFEVLELLDSYYPGTLYFQGKSGRELTRSLADLERELSTGKIDAVFLDPFYGLSDVYGKNVNKTAGGAAEYAATRFENIVGDYDVVGFYTVQATVDKKEVSEDGVRELRIPTREKVKTTSRLLDIATNLIGFDSVSKEGIAGIGIEKGRNGGEDFMLELVALFDYGVLREFPKGESAAEQFEF
ncbi:replicative DNA helicase [Bacillus sonorensis]|uniref:Replicative DNA helicase n=2 Tax=Bacillus sonorensis TaxID=119858 RepID=M5P9R0_9BACI|nr:DnaB-like helicase C-terminal domain-containing protein [Bacillus sonorensis]EME76178.1 Replicative DNA helicase [Bacillus sonorensis L12]MCZ0074645.1 replicative DNA helicase [Bacillus sonorensis]MCZ0093753.1 replicative DNA helicase [Bacillus sonorensis]PAD61892.1 DNA helicase [Bacillus sonorensis]RHJ13930.1 DNA helicase [Bacillus sonorensis]